MLSAMKLNECPIRDWKVRAIAGSPFFRLSLAGHGHCDSPGEISQIIADRDDAGQFALEKNRNVAVAADVHFVEGVGDFFLGLECDRIWRHELRDWAGKK